MDEYIRIAHVANEVEADMLDAILNDRGIPHALVSLHDSAFDGLFQLQGGWGAIDGPVDRREEILEILGGLRKEATDA